MTKQIGLSNEDQKVLDQLLAKKAEAEKLDKDVKAAIRRIEDAQESLRNSVNVIIKGNENKRNVWQKLDTAMPDTFVLQTRESIQSKDAFYSWDLKNWKKGTKKEAFKILGIPKVDKFSDVVKVSEITIPKLDKAYVIVDGEQMQVESGPFGYSGNRMIKHVSTLVKKVKDAIDTKEYQMNAANVRKQLIADAVGKGQELFGHIHGAKVEFYSEWKSSRFSKRGGYHKDLIKVKFEKNQVENLYYFKKNELNNITLSLKSTNFSVLEAVCANKSLQEQAVELVELKGNLNK